MTLVASRWRAFLILAPLLLAGCYSPPDEAELRIKVVNGATRQPLAGTLVAIEKGGIYVTNPDPARGNPSFVYGTRVGNDGTVILELPSGQVGVHTFYPGHYYGSRLIELDQDLGITVNMEAFQNNEAAPTIANAKLEPQALTPGAEFVVSADVNRGSADDPLSEEVVVVFPTDHFSRALDPPSAGIQGKEFPDGTWKTTLTAPDAPGVYTYYLTATTEHCVTSDPTPLTLDVQ